MEFAIATQNEFAVAESGRLAPEINKIFAKYELDMPKGKLTLRPKRGIFNLFGLIPKKELALEQEEGQEMLGPPESSLPIPQLGPAPSGAAGDADIIQNLLQQLPGRQQAPAVSDPIRQIFGELDTTIEAELGQQQQEPPDITEWTTFFKDELKRKQLTADDRAKLSELGFSSADIEKVNKSVGAKKHTTLYPNLDQSDIGAFVRPRLEGGVVTTQEQIDDVINGLKLLGITSTDGPLFRTLKEYGFSTTEVEKINEAL